MASSDGLYRNGDNARASEREAGQGGSRSSSRPESPLDQLRNARTPPFPSSSTGPNSLYFSSLPGRAGGLLASRRARQIQADEGIVPAPYRAPAMRQGTAQGDQMSPIVPPGYKGRPTTGSQAEGAMSQSESRPLHGRARAGTLPSSWNNVFDHTPSPQRPSGMDDPAGIIGERPASGSASSSMRSGRPWSTSISQCSPGSIGGVDIDSNLASLRLDSTNSSPLYSGYAQDYTTAGRFAPPREPRSNSVIDYEKPALPAYLSSDSSTSSNLSPPSSFDAGSHATTTYTNRNRSGSLTANLPGLSTTAFGPSMFSSTWADQPGQSRFLSPNTRSLSGRGNNSLATLASEDKSNKNRVSFDLEVPAQRGSEEDRQSQLEGNEGVHTLDYLGLEHDDSSHMRSVYGPQSTQPRNRASTLASVPPRTALGRHYSPTTQETDKFYEGEGNIAAAQQGGLDASQYAALVSAAEMQATGSAAASHAGRLRAGTVAALGGPGGRQRIEQELLRMASLNNGTGLNDVNVSALLQTLQAASSGAESLYSKAPLEGFPHLNIVTPPLTTPNLSSPFQTSPSTPSIGIYSGGKPGMGDEGSYSPWVITESPSATPNPDANTRIPNQTPSRSLWVGNLDSSMTGQELMRIFAPYGAIESLRLLPEKECGFVNFVDMNDAIRARDDVLGRLGGRLEHFGSGTGGTVRIGYGKIDSVPSQTHGKPSASGQPISGFVMRAHDSTSGFEAAGSSNWEATTAAGSDGGGPTRALWVGSIPSSVTPAMLLSIFQPFGPIESARILTHKNCGFINFERVDDAIRARKTLHGRDVLGSEVGALRIGFAKAPARNVDPSPGNGSDPSQYEVAVESIGSLSGVKVAPRGGEQQAMSGGGGGFENYRNNVVVNLSHPREVASGPTNLDSVGHPAPLKQGPSSSSSIVPASDKGGVPLPAYMAPRPSLSDLQLLMEQLSMGQTSKDADVESMTEQRSAAEYYMVIPLISDISSGRRFETSKLRETRRAIESGMLQMRDCDQLAIEYLDSIVDLASDYIGNTLVQKFFEHCSEPIKMEMLSRLAPHLAMTGCHKNGTWAAQKILDCCKTSEQITLIAKHLRPYIPGLLLDQFGNYVVQCCLRWKQPRNDFVFEAMVDRCWEIAQGRFGARSMRACLENEHVTDQQRKKVAIAAILHSVPLATSPNGSILLTWLLDSSGLHKSFNLLAPRFAPNLTHLCTHKLASTPVLRLINQTAEPEARRIILDALFESAQDRVLEDIVVDQVHGSQLVTKVLASPGLSKDQRQRYAEQVRGLVEKHRLVGVPAYRRLCEDLGLLPPSNGGAA